jgi:pimeloyl-ACP methyl ester carboxylesterase
MKFLKYIIFLLIFLLIQNPQNSAASKGDYVVVLHGIARSSDSMKKMVSHLTSHGYDTLNIDYPSTKLSLEELVEHINREVLSFNFDFNRKIHFVSYSMGGLLVRGLLSKYPPNNLGRVVMLAPPNLGSEATDFWKDKWIYKYIYGPAGQQITTDQSNLKNFFGKIDYELGIIAGDRSIDPFHSFIIPGTDDGKVAVERTKVEKMKDHIVIHATHTFIMNNKKALHQTTNFLNKGQFSKT